MRNTMESTIGLGSTVSTAGNCGELSSSPRRIAGAPELRRRTNSGKFTTIFQPFQDVSGVDVPLNQAIEYDKYYTYPLNGMFSGKMKTNHQLWRRPILRQIDVNGCLPAVVAHIFISRLCAYEQTFKSPRCSRCRLAVYLHLSTVLSEQNLAQNLRNRNNHPTVPT